MALKQIVLAATLAVPGPALADQAGELLDTIGVPGIVGIMRDEGLDYGEDLYREVLDRTPNAAWKAEVDRIYEAGKMEQMVRDGFVPALDGVDIAPLLDFFESKRGRRIVRLEQEARRAMLDADVEAAARETFRAIDGTGDPRKRRLDAFIAANDLIDANVASALGSSYLFYRGLVDGEGFEMGEEQIISDVRAQEPATRRDTREWLYAYLMLAYGPLDDAVLDEYTELSASKAGKAMNAALFAGFDKMYGEIAYQLGLGIARQMQGRDL